MGHTKYVDKNCLMSQLVVQVFTAAVPWQYVPLCKWNQICSTQLRSITRNWCLIFWNILWPDAPTHNNRTRPFLCIQINHHGKKLNGSHPLNKRAQNVTKSLTSSYVAIRVLINLVFDTCPAFWMSEVKVFPPIMSVITTEHLWAELRIPWHFSRYDTLLFQTNATVSQADSDKTGY